MRKLKFLLDIRSLVEIIYISFISPRLEYADVVLNNCTRYEVNALVKIQREAARIVTGATKLVSLEVLCNETGWESLETRRSKHKMCLFYKMNDSISHNYRSSLVPHSVETTTHYSYVMQQIYDILLRGHNCTVYYDSFIPCSIRLWNDLPSVMRESNTYTNFTWLVTDSLKYNIIVSELFAVP